MLMPTKLCFMFVAILIVASMKAFEEMFAPKKARFHLVKTESRGKKV